MACGGLVGLRVAVSGAGLAGSRGKKQGFQQKFSTGCGKIGGKNGSFPQGCGRRGGKLRKVWEKLFVFFGLRACACILRGASFICALTLADLGYCRSIAFLSSQTAPRRLQAAQGRSRLWNPPFNVRTLDSLHLCSMRFGLFCLAINEFIAKPHGGLQGQVPG